MVKTLRFILGDQLSRDVSSLDGLDPAQDVVLMVEVAGRDDLCPASQAEDRVRSSRPCAILREALRDAGIAVDYVALDDPGNTGSFTGELARAVERHSAGPDRRHRARRMARARDDARLAAGAWPFPSRSGRTTASSARAADFARWAKERKALRMEFFYREMRRETGLLMEGDKPVGGEWNFDAENRKSLPRGRTRRRRACAFDPTPSRARCIDLVARALRRIISAISNPSAGRVTRAECAGRRWTHFIDRLPADFRRLSGRDEERRGLPLSRRALALSQ